MFKGALIAVAASARLEPGTDHLASRRLGVEVLAFLELSVSREEVGFRVFILSSATSAAACPAFALATSFSLFDFFALVACGACGSRLSPDRGRV